jgi:DNA end-binding protein Ku
MAARATWKGYLKVSLVNIPIRVFPATDSAASISFNQLHAECQTRIQQKKWCPHCEREVPNSELVKGYEFEKGRYVVVSVDDIEKVRPASTRVIDLQQFAERDELDPIYFERPYYLAPDTQVAADAFAVIREGMAGKVGIGKVALYGREYLVAVEAREKGLVMYTLRQADEIRAMDEVSEYDLLPEKPKAAEVQLARQVISTFEKPLDLKQYKDEYQAELRRIIDAKVAGEEVVATEVETPSKVVDLMEALRKSLANVSEGKKKPAKADIAETKEAKAKKAAPKRKAG